MLNRNNILYLYHLIFHLGNIDFAIFCPFSAVFMQEGSISLTNGDSIALTSNLTTFH